MSTIEQEPEARALRSRIKELESQIDGLTEEYSELERKNERLQDGVDSKADDAINTFLDEVERPTGKLKFTVPQTDAVNRAILGLFDAIGRRP